MTTADPTTQLIHQFRAAAEAAGFTVETFGLTGHYPLLGMTRATSAPSERSRHIYLSAGIHGDEPAGPQAVLELLEAKALPEQHHYTLCPLLNPTGLAAGTRENKDRIDLNRDYRKRHSPEIRAHTAWVAAHIRQLDCALHLHEDWESQGFYLYELNFSGKPGHADDILRATGRFLPIESATEIDDSVARDGVIRPETLPEIEEGDPEAIYIQRNYGGLNYTLETPSALDFRLRVDALKAAVGVVL